MSTSFAPAKQLTANKYPIDMSPAAFGELRESNDCLSQPQVMRRRMEEDGYIFLRDYLGLDNVLNARREVL